MSVSNWYFQVTISDSTKNEYVNFEQITSDKTGYMKLKLTDTCESTNSKYSFPSKTYYLVKNTTKYYAETASTAHTGKLEQTFYFYIPNAERRTAGWTFYGQVGNSGNHFVMPSLLESSFTVSDGTINGTTPIVITAVDSSLTHTLQYKVGSGSYTNIFTKSSSTSYIWTIPNSIYNSMTASAKSKQITLRLITYNGSAELGEYEKTMLAYAEAIAPTITTSYSTTDYSSLTGDTDTIIKGQSAVTVGLEATCANGATVASYTIEAGTTDNHTLQTIYSNSFSISACEFNYFTLTAIDSRGNTASTVIEKTMVNYFNPTIQNNISNPNPTTGVVTVTSTGTAFTGSFGSATNSITLQIRYRVKGTTSWSYASDLSLTIDKTNNTFSGTNTFTVDYTKTYEVQAYIHDKLGNHLGTTVKTIKAIPVFSWDEDDFEFNVDTNVNGNAKVTGDLEVSGLIKGTLQEQDIDRLDDVLTKVSGNTSINNYNQAYIIGNVVMITIELKPTASISAKKNIFTGKISDDYSDDLTPCFESFAGSASVTDAVDKAVSAYYVNGTFCVDLVYGASALATSNEIIATFVFLKGNGLF